MENFNIQPKLFYNIDGTTKTGTSILLRVLPYSLFSSSITCYYEIKDENNQLINEGKNLTIPTPDNWGENDKIVLDAFAKELKVSLIYETNNN